MIMVTTTGPTEARAITYRRSGKEEEKDLKIAELERKLAG
jgi:hypothetical protein